MVKPEPPSISVNKLGEYIVSRANRQREILRDRKYRTEYKGMYYRESSDAIGRCIASNLEDLSSLARAKTILEQRAPDKIGTQRRVNANIDAIEAFDVLLDTIDLQGATPELGTHSAHHRIPAQC